MEQREKILLIGTVVSTILVTILSIGMIKAVLIQNYLAEAIMVCISAVLLAFYYYFLLFYDDRKKEKQEQENEDETLETLQDALDSLTN